MSRKIAIGDVDETVNCFASYTNWKPIQMTPFLKFIESIDKDKTDILEDMKHDDKCRDEVQSENDLNLRELKVFVDRYNAYKNKILTQW